MSKRRSFSPLTARLAAGALPLAALLVSPAASAHFRLETPASWNSQDASGSPQKAPPCGDDGGTPTGIVTAFQAGQTISITINETIFHPGHYRVALAVNDRSELPPEPVVTPDASSPCGSVPIDSQPAFPVLADGVLIHTKPLSGPQTFEVTLPAGVTCEHCTLQIIEFMSNHGLNNPGGCFYHHCADLSISAPSGAGGSGDAGAAGMSAGGSPGASGAASTAGSGGSVTGTGGAAGSSTGGSSASAAGHDDHAHTGGSAGVSAGMGGAGRAGSGAGGASASGGASSGAGGEPAGSSEDDSGCSTSAGMARGGTVSALLLVALGRVARRSRRRRSR